MTDRLPHRGQGLGRVLGLPEDRATRHWLLAVLLVAVGLPILLAAGLFVFRNEIVATAVAYIPVEQEKRLADELWKVHRARLKLIEGTAANLFVETLGDRLAAARPTPYRYRIHIADDPAINAFALPAGIIVINRGLIENAANAEEIAGVLAHEIEHVEHRDALRGMARALGVTVIWIVLTGDAGSGILGDWLRNLAELHFSREQEAEADEAGHARLLAAKIDPRGLASFFKRLAEHQGDLPGVLALLSTHPPSEERAAKLDALLRAAPAFAPLEPNWKAIQDSLARPPKPKDTQAGSG